MVHWTEIGFIRKQYANKCSHLHVSQTVFFFILYKEAISHLTLLRFRTRALTFCLFTARFYEIALIKLDAVLLSVDRCAGSTTLIYDFSKWTATANEMNVYRSLLMKWCEDAVNEFRSSANILLLVAAEQWRIQSSTGYLINLCLVPRRRY